MMHAVAGRSSSRALQCRLSPVQTHGRRHNRRLVVTNAVQTETKPAIAQFADNIGLPTDEGLFGFKPFSEVWCGRLAMMGFVSSIAVELQTGQGTLQQIGIYTPSTGLFFALLALVGVGTLGGAAVTTFQGLSGKLSKRDVERYRKFLLLDKEDDEIVQKPRVDGMPADKFLAVNNDEQAIEAARAALSNDASSSSVSEAQPAEAVASTSVPEKSYDELVFSNSELQYARTVETDNGRAAMLGFLMAVLVEAATGKGIVLQLIMWFKFMGLLGYESGF